MWHGVTSCVPGTHDLPGLARFWAQALGWRSPSGRERAIVIGPARTRRPAGVLLPVTDRNMVKHRVQPGLTSSATDHKQEIGRLLAPGRAGPTWADRR